MSALSQSRRRNPFRPLPLLAAGLILGIIIIVLGPGAFLPENYLEQLLRTGQTVQVIPMDPISDGTAPPPMDGPEFKNQKCHVLNRASYTSNTAVESIKRGTTAMLLDGRNVVGGFWIEGAVAHLVIGNGAVLDYWTVSKEALIDRLSGRYHGGNQITARINSLKPKEIKGVMTTSSVRKAFNEGCSSYDSYSD